ncbi:hypothetical protein J6590_009807 [Homalodisca vitripennis]|nr:hypothetical protein J6590_009807 [Homalodisca vitripennis]
MCVHTERRDQQQRRTLLSAAKRVSTLSGATNKSDGRCCRRRNVCSHCAVRPTTATDAADGGESCVYNERRVNTSARGGRSVGRHVRDPVIFPTRRYDHMISYVTGRSASNALSYVRNFGAKSRLC